MHPPSCRVTRRRVILALLLGLVAGRAPGLADTVDHPTVAPVELPPWLARLRGERDATARLGEAYLRAYPAERSLAVLLAAIEEAIGAQRRSNGAAGDALAALEQLQRAVRDDYVRGEVVSVDGWLVSRTEARVYAVIALHAVQVTDR